MAFVCVGTVVAALGFLFGPFLGQLWRVGVETIEHGVEKLEAGIEKKLTKKD